MIRLACIHCLLALVPGCTTSSRSEPAQPAGRRSVALSWTNVTVTCQLRYYLVGPLSKARATFRVARQDKKSLICSVDEPARLLTNADANVVGELSGFVFQICRPSEHEGKILTAHFDGPLASGDPFKAFEFGKSYEMDVPIQFIGKDGFSICY